MKKNRLLWVVLLLCGCDVFGVSTRDTKSDLQAEASAWLKQGIHNYSYEFTRTCFCEVEGTLVVTVRNDTINSVVTKSTGDPASQPFSAYFTIPQLYDYLIDAADQAEDLTVNYDHTTHLPSQVVIDFTHAAADDQIALAIQNFVEQ